MIRFIEELSMNAWPSLQTYLYDGWVLRVSNGYTKRANSVNPIYSSKIDIIQKIECCRAFYEKFGLPTIYKITSDGVSLTLDNKLHDLGYKRIDETSVRVINLKMHNLIHETSAEVRYEYSEEWLDEYIASTKMDINNAKTLRSMLKCIIGKTIWITQRECCKAVGFGYGVIDKGYVGIFDIYVDESYRGKGYGKDVMNSILSEASKLGANKAYLQVVVSNTVADNLYRKLGFEEVYRYWYRKL
ncbi:GNAT family N-acetyltransferase [Vallitalea okinawensis]|uniref:GNAT family N-acetyltransferase n=1 Tax=Vallitalea okinawensis TaxID=2078660 RepID=UPI000CFD7203|nr:GNAT family N-acetyltransferase [Vallitalea okinawensis]